MVLGQSADFFLLRAHLRERVWRDKREELWGFKWAAKESKSDGEGESERKGRVITVSGVARSPPARGPPIWCTPMIRILISIIEIVLPTFFVYAGPSLPHTLLPLLTHLIVLCGLHKVPSQSVPLRPDPP